jgi:hypothetical protein
MEPTESLLPPGLAYAILESVRRDQPDGTLYEDDAIVMTRKNGQVQMTGKPLADVIIYGKFAK